MQLTNGFVLQGGKYIIESVLGQGSFGITYLATTKFQGPLGEISVKVAIKEFFAHDLNLRHPDGTVAEVSSGSLSGKYAKDFQREAKNLSSLKHPNIINVLEAFSENNTHYYVMEYLDGGNLDDYIQSKGRLNESEALDIASQMASALSYMHSHNMLHLDLKPKNVMRRSDGRVCLIDFGLSKQYESSGEPESSTTIGLGTPGYAPLEQGSSDERKNFAPTLDVYALGASIFKMLTGKTPPRASDIMNDGFPSEELEALGVRSETIQMIERLMSPRKKDRPQSVEECGLMAADRCIPKETASCTDDTELLKEEAGEETEVVEAPGPEKDVRATDHKKQEQNHWKWGLLMIAILALLGFGGIRYYNHQKNLEYQRQILVEEARRQAVADSLKAVEEENARIAAEKAEQERIERERKEREEAERKKREISYSNGMLRVKGVEYPMVYVEGGTFLMGDSVGGSSDSKPAHWVTLDSYHIGKYEVTQELWEVVMGNNPSRYKGSRKPVEMVSWNDCQEFIRKLNHMTGQSFKLPTEAQWEFAARGGNKRGNKSKGYDDFPGSNHADNIGWYDDNSGNTTHNVGLKTPNELGLYDMGGNVSEHCSDWRGNYEASSETNPTGPATGPHHVIRGGDYLSVWGDLWVYSRPLYHIRGNSEDYAHASIGLRLCL